MALKTATKYHNHNNDFLLQNHLNARINLEIYDFSKCSNYIWNGLCTKYTQSLKIPLFIAPSIEHTHRAISNTSWLFAVLYCLFCYFFRNTTTLSAATYSNAAIYSNLVWFFWRKAIKIVFIFTFDKAQSSSRIDRNTLLIGAAGQLGQQNFYPSVTVRIAFKGNCSLLQLTCWLAIACKFN